MTTTEPRNSTADHGGHGGTVTSNEAPPGETPQRLRIYVPTGDAELVMGLNDDRHLGIRARTVATVHRTANNKTLGTLAGKEDEVNLARTRIGLGVNERGFVGVIATADHGNVLLVATGAADVGSDFNHATRVGTIIETSINVVRIGLLLWSARYNEGHAAILPSVLGVAQGVWAGFNAVTSPFSGDPSSGLGNMDYLKTGHVTLFGARSVKMESIEGISSSAALFNSHSAGLSASLNSIVAASVNSGFLASVNGAFSASINGASASVVGGADAGVSSRVGGVRIEGRTVRIGTKKQAGSKAKLLSGIQEATEDVWVRARDFIEVGIPSQLELPENPLVDWLADGFLIGMTKHPIGMQVARGAVRINSERAVLKLGNTVASIAGQSVLKVGPDGIELARLKVKPALLAGTAMSTARLAFNTSWGLSEGIVKQLKATMTAAGGAKTKVALAIVGGAAVAGGAMAGEGAIAGKGTGEAGAAEGAKLGAITGAALGAVGMAATLAMISMKAAGLAQRAGQALAKKTYFAALTAARTAENAATLVDPTAPKVEVKDSHVLLSFGPPGAGCSVKLSSSGVEIKGMKVTVNDMEIGPPMIPAVPSVPIIPEVEVPDLVVGGIPAEASVLL